MFPRLARLEVHSSKASEAFSRVRDGSAHVNLIWTPIVNSDLGLEYIYADRETEDGLKGHLNRLQASAKYPF